MVVGLGAAGGVAVLPLAQAGLDVVGLEAGTWLAPADFSPDELRNNYRGWPQSVQKANREVPTHRPTASAPASPRPAIHPMMNAVGGTTLHYWAQSWRLHPWDFTVVSETRRRYGASRIPKGYTVEDWPFGYDELEPYYDKVEVEIGVSGPGRQHPRRHRQARQHLRRPAGARLSDAAAARHRVHRHDGRRPRGRSAGTRSPGRRRSIRGRYQNRAGCVYHGFCARGGCHVSAKGSTAVTTIPKAQRTKRLTVVTEAHVTTIEVNGQGRATGVNYLKGGTEYFQPADVVLLAGYVYENVRLLLLSTSPAFPKGLSNNHGQVGRHYFSHNQVSTVSALFPRELNSLVRAAGAGRGRGQLGRRQLRPRGPRLHRRRQPLGLFRPAADRRRRHEHVRPRAALGLAVEGVRQGERRPLRTPPICRRPRCRTKRTTWTSTRR